MVKLLRGMLEALDEERIERRFGSRLAARLIFTAVARSYVPGSGAGFEGCLLYELTRPATGREMIVWHIEIRDGRARARRGACPAPALALRLRLADILRIGAGTLDPAVPILQGRGTFEGSLGLAMRLPEMFGAGR